MLLRPPLLFFVLVSCFGLASSVSLADAPPEDVSPSLESIRSKHDLPALAAAAVREGKIVAIGATGLRKLGSAERVTLGDKWHIGSCGKSMTASVAALLVESGKLKWETSLGEAFAPTQGMMKPEWAGVTLEQLLVHRSGAPGVAPPALWAEASRRRGKPAEQRLRFVRGLLSSPLEATPGIKFIYSNQGYAIAGTMMERAVGQEWEDLLRTSLLVPLGLKSAGFGAPATIPTVDQPWGHRDENGRLAPVPPGPLADNPPAIAPAGTLHCSIDDFARYAGWHAHRGRGPDALLQEASFAKLHSAAEGEPYAMGFAVHPRPWAGGAALTHVGSNTMFYAVMWIAPEKDLAFVAATNCASKTASAACDEAVAELLRQLSHR